MVQTLFAKPQIEPNWSKWSETWARWPVVKHNQLYEVEEIVTRNEGLNCDPFKSKIWWFFFSHQKDCSFIFSWRYFPFCWKLLNLFSCQMVQTLFAKLPIEPNWSKWSETWAKWPVVKHNQLYEVEEIVTRNEGLNCDPFKNYC